MGFAEETGRLARSAAASWGRTARTCLLMLSAAVAAAVFLTLFQVVLPMLYGPR